MKENIYQPKKKKNFLNRLYKIFDLITCQCEILDCNESHECSGVHIIYKCPRESRVPDMEAAWLKDQRLRNKNRDSEYYIAGIDTKEATSHKKKIARKARAEALQKENRTQEQGPRLATEDVNENEIPDYDLDKEFMIHTITNKNNNQNRLNLDYFVAEVIRYGCSDRGAAALFNAALKSVGLICDGDDKLAVDKNKIRRARDSFGAQQKAFLNSEVAETGGLKCIGTDGKRNKKHCKKNVKQ